MKQIVAQRLRQRREAMGWSQVDLAKESKVSQSTISRYEAAGSEITGSHLIALAHALETTADYLLGLTDEVKPSKQPDKLNELERAIVNLMRTKSHESQRKIVDIARVV